MNAPTRAGIGWLWFLGVSRALAAFVTDEELTERRNWVAARFEGRQPPPRTDPALVVFANHGPVIKNARAGKPLRVGQQTFARGLLAHAPSKVLIQLPAPGEAFTAVVGIDSNEQTNGGRGSVDFSVHVGGTETFRSGVLREGMAGKAVRVDLGGATQFVSVAFWYREGAHPVVALPPFKERTAGSFTPNHKRPLL